MNSPSTFQRIMELIVGDLNLSELIFYLDDVLVFSQTVSEQVDRLETVFHRLQEHGLKFRDWPVPSTVADIRSFLDLASYYRLYIDKSPPWLVLSMHLRATQIHGRAKP